MRVVLGRRGDYSVRAVLDLARHWGRERRKARQIAETMDIPERYLTQLLANLVRHELLVAVAGPDGGYSLARPPSEISLLEVVEAAEGPIGLDECVLSGGPCDWIGECPVHDDWSEAQKALQERLDAADFAQLADRDASIEKGRGRPNPHATNTSRTGHRV